MGYQDQGALQAAEPVLVEKWGLETISLGYVAVPDILLEEMGAAGISPTEMVMLLQLMRYWWTPGQWPFPSKRTLAKAMDCSEKNAQKVLAKLERRGLVKRIQNRYRGDRSDSNIYDMSGLVGLVGQLSRSKLALRAGLA